MTAGRLSSAPSSCIRPADDLIAVLEFQQVEHPTLVPAFSPSGSISASTHQPLYWTLLALRQLPGSVNEASGYGFHDPCPCGIMEVL